MEALEADYFRALETPRIAALSPNLIAAAFPLMKLMPARYILDRAAADGALKAGARVVETTSGTFGMALALLAAARGYQLTLVTATSLIDAKYRARLETIGATVITINDPGGNGDQVRRLERLERIRRKEPDCFWPRQYDNPGNWLAYARLAELLVATAGKIDIDELVDALGGLGERLLFLRPFIPDKANALPANWKAILRSWVSGEEVSKIGPQNMRAVEEAFTYRLVWALEAVRTRRMSLGWSPETVAGGAAAAVETGVPQFMMSMLIRAGLPSRRAAMAAIEDAKPVYVTPAEMRAWLESDEITVYTDAGDWPTPDTAALWARFRTEALSGGIQKWAIERYKRLLDTAAAPPAGLYRIVTDEGDGRTWLTTPDYQRVAAFKKPAVDPKPSLFSGRLRGNTRLVDALRVGRGKLRWPPADA